MAGVYNGSASAMRQFGELLSSNPGDNVSHLSTFVRSLGENRQINFLTLSGFLLCNCT